MGMRINLNSAAMTAHRMMTNTDTALGKSIERLSSGYKINSAADDPAGLVISEKLRAQVSGLTQAIRNASDAVNMVKTAEGALNEVSTMLRSMRDLAVHAANTGATDKASVEADQAQINSAIDTLNKIAAETQFGNKKLLDGSAGITSTITGSSVLAANFSNSVLPSDSAFHVDMSAASGGVAAAKASITGTADVSGGNASGGKWSVSINGVSVDFADGMTQAQMVDQINNVTNQTGVVASASGNFIQLTQKEYGSDKRIDVTGANAADVFGAASLAAVGVDAVAKITSDGTTDLTDTGVWNKGHGLTLEDSKGNTICLTDAAGTTQTDKGKQGDIKVGTLTFQVGAYANQTRSLSISAMSAANIATTVVPGQSVATVDVLNHPQDAINILDGAISEISGLRASLGAFQKNVLESSINSLTIAKENISASESTIRDTDMAEEVQELTRNQILQQAGTSMLAQANQSPQTLLSLLKS